VKVLNRRRTLKEPGIPGGRSESEGKNVKRKKFKNKKRKK
jgi:hypothetical protein